MKPRFASLTAAVIAFMIINAVFTVTAGAEQAVVRLWNVHIHDKKFTQKMVKLFNLRNPDIKWEYSSIEGGTYPQVLEASFVAREPPDIFYPGGAMTYQNLLAKGLIAAVNDIASSVKEYKDWVSHFPPELQRSADLMDAGKVYMFSLAGENSGVNPLLWNKTLFKEAGIAAPPKIQSELRQVAAKLTQAGQGKSFGIIHAIKGGAEMWPCDLNASLAHAAGARGINGLAYGGPDKKDGKFHLSGPEFTAAMKLWISMRKDGSVFPGETLMNDEQAKMLFATNKAGLQFGGWWSPSNYIAYNPDVDFDEVLPPTPDDGINRGYVYVPPPGAPGAQFGYVVSALSKNPKAVWELVKFISSLEYQEGYVKGGYGISYLTEANKPENFTVPQTARFAAWAKDPALRRVEPWRSRASERAIEEFFPVVYPPLNDVMTNVYLEKAGFEAFKDLDQRWDEAVDVGIKRAQQAGIKVSRADFVFADWDPTKDYVQQNLE